MLRILIFKIMLLVSIETVFSADYTKTLNEGEAEFNERSKSAEQWRRDEKNRQIRAAKSASQDNSINSSGSSIYHPTNKYTLICREQGLLSEHIATISIDCTGTEIACKQQFENTVSEKYGSFSSACAKLVKNNWYFSTVRIE